MESGFRSDRSVWRFDFERATGYGRADTRPIRPGHERISLERMVEHQVMGERSAHPRLEALRKKRRLEREQNRLERELQQERQQKAELVAENRRLKLVASQAE